MNRIRAQCTIQINITANISYSVQKKRRLKVHNIILCNYVFICTLQQINQVKSAENRFWPTVRAPLVSNVVCLSVCRL